MLQFLLTVFPEEAVSEGLPRMDVWNGGHVHIIEPLINAQQCGTANSDLGSIPFGGIGIDRNFSVEQFFTVLVRADFLHAPEKRMRKIEGGGKPAASTGLPAGAQLPLLAERYFANVFEYVPVPGRGTLSKSFPDDGDQAVLLKRPRPCSGRRNTFPGIANLVKIIRSSGRRARRGRMRPNVA